MPETEVRRRRRPAVSCSLCRKRKIRCNREFPCSNCLRSKTGTCTYEGHADAALHRRTTPDEESNPTRTQSDESWRSSEDVSFASLVPHTLNRSSVVGGVGVAGESNAACSTPTSTPRDLENKIAQLEDQLLRIKALSLPPTPHKPQTPSSLQTLSAAQTPQDSSSSQADKDVEHLAAFPKRQMSAPAQDVVLHESEMFGTVKTTRRGILHKRRFFGQTHWICSVILIGDIMEIAEPALQGRNGNIVQMMRRCKALARVIKSSRTPVWPTLPTPDLPPKEVADELVDNYLRTIEAQYRILHIPTFRKNYEAVWTLDSERDKDFLVQLKLVLAIGATTYDDTFSLRPSAIRWVYEAQTWISQPHAKHRLTLATVQTEMLHLLAQEMVGVDGSLTWIGIGSLLRMMIYMGMHQDSAQVAKRSLLTTEMRRRLFNTLLELLLATSMISGGPPLISSEDFSIAPPGNFDDDQLLEDDPVPKPSHITTDTSTAIALRKSFPLRLSILKYLNDVGAENSYEETLRLDAELREAYKILRISVLGLNTNSGAGFPAGMNRGSTPNHVNSQCTMQLLDLLMNRYFMALYLPFFSAALQNKAYAYARVALIDACIKAWRTIFPRPQTSDNFQQDNASTDLLRRLTICACGFFRTIFHQSSMSVCAELAAQIREGEALGPVMLRSDLLEMLECSKDWFYRCAEVGDTSIKGYLVTCIAAEPIRCYLEGGRRDQLTDRLIITAEESLRKCIVLLEARAAASQTETGPGMAEVADLQGMDMPIGATDNWEYLMPGMDLDPQLSNDPMHWFFGNIEAGNSMTW